MHNIHLNPFFIINNVIFINTKKNFVYLDRTAWDTIHRTIFGNRRSSNDQRKKLHRLFYDLYYGYVYNEDGVDARLFNDQVDCIKWNTETCDPKPDHGSATFYSETMEPIEGYIDDKAKIENEEVAMTVRHYGLVSKDHDIRERLTLFLNTLVSTSEDYRLLVEYIGFGRCLSKLTQFVVEDHFRYNNEVEGVLFTLFVKMGEPNLRLKVANRNFDFICYDCNNIGCHINSRIPAFKVTNVEVNCYPGFSRWFDKNGFIDIHYGVEDTIRNNEKRLEAKYLTNGKINGYHNVNTFRYGMFTVDRRSEKDLETLKTECMVAIILDNFKTKYDYCYKDQLHRFNSSQEDLEHSKVLLDRFTSTLSSCTSYAKLMENKDKLEDYYVAMKDFYRKFNSRDDFSEGFSSVVSSSNSFNSIKDNDPFKNFWKQTRN